MGNANGISHTLHSNPLCSNTNARMHMHISTAVSAMSSMDCFAITSTPRSVVLILQYSSSLFASSKLIVQTRCASDLARGELIHTSVVRVVHPVVDAIHTSSVRARVLSAGATARGSSLDRSVGDEVAGAGARRALEDMVETEPVSGLVDGSGTLVVIGC